MKKMNKQQFEIGDKVIIKGTGFIGKIDHLIGTRVAVREINNPIDNIGISVVEVDDIELFEEDKPQESLVDTFFKAYDIAPYERFKIKFENGLIKGLYYYDDKLVLHNEGNNVTCVLGNKYLSDIICGIHKIVKIKKPLLTDEEREFLINFEFDSLQIKQGILYFYIHEKRDDGFIHCIELKHFSHKFYGLEDDKEYTREELGL